MQLIITQPNIVMYTYMYFWHHTLLPVNILLFGGIDVTRYLKHGSGVTPAAKLLRHGDGVDAQRRAVRVVQVHGLVRQFLAQAASAAHEPD